MKRILLLSLSLLIIGTLHAQQRDDQRMMRRKSTGSKKTGGACPRVYLGFSTGINNPVGLIGPQIDIAVTPAVSIGTGVGASSWGTKTFLEGRYYFRPCNRGWAIGGGFTYNTGLNNVQLRVETIYGDNDIHADLKPQANFMVSGYHFFNLGRSGRNRFHLQGGFSIPLSTASFSSTSEPYLTEKGRNSILGLAPGGLIIGLGFSFGLGS